MGVIGASWTADFLTKGMDAGTPSWNWRHRRLSGYYALPEGQRGLFVGGGGPYEFRA